MLFCSLEDQVARGLSRQGLVWILQLKFDVISRVTLQKDVLSFQTCELLALLLVE